MDFDSLRPAGKHCLTCGRQVGPDETLVAVLVEIPRPVRLEANAAGRAARFQRLDYCPACWADSPWLASEQLLDEGQSAHPADLYGADPVAVWSCRASQPEKPRRPFLDDAVLTSFFLRLADAEESEHLRFRFVLMLILLRHRKLRHEGTERTGQGDVWLVRLSPAMAEATGAPPEQIHRVLDPHLDESQAAQVAEQLRQIFQEDLDSDTENPP